MENLDLTCANYCIEKKEKMAAVKRATEYRKSIKTKKAFLIKESLLTLATIVIFNATFVYVLFDAFLA